MKRNPKGDGNGGFTLIEILLVIAIIAVLAVVVFVALNPGGRLADARNSRRFNDVNSLLTAIHEYTLDNDGALPTGLTTGMGETQLGSCASGGATLCTGASAVCVNLTAPLAAYLKSIPLDPKDGVAATTGYSVTVDANNIVTVISCRAESGETIQVSR